MMNDTIIAVCTAPGLGALALLRLDGARARLIAQLMAKTATPERISNGGSHSIVYGHVVDSAGHAIDQVLFLIMYAPRTFTGNEVVEITCHNNPFIVQAIIERACDFGARPAQPGEFAQRALMNGKIDILQAEAIHELIMAPSRALVNASLAQLEGSLSQVVRRIEVGLVTIAALMEASFEFSEEEHIDLDFDRVVRDNVREIIGFVDTISASQSGMQQLREGVRIALVGGVNAGKSTLLNTLLGRNRAIVSSMPGTTRDSIEAGMSREGYSWTYIDTAGLRVTGDAIEQEGILRSRDAAAAADVVLLVVDGSVAPLDESVAECRRLIHSYGKKSVLVLTKADCGGHAQWHELSLCDDVVTVSAHNGAGLDALREIIFNRVKSVYESIDTPFILNQRQLALVREIGRRLDVVMTECTQPRPSYELISTGVHDMLSLITELSGHSISQQVMDTVFSSFCIGK